MHAQRRQPDTIHRVRALIAPLPAQIERLYEVLAGYRERRGRRTLEFLIKRPRAAGYGNIPHGIMQRGEHREPRCELVSVVSDDEDARPKVKLCKRRAGIGSSGIESVHFQRCLGRFRVMVPGCACAQIDAVAVVALCDENMGEKAISATVHPESVIRK